MSLLDSLTEHVLETSEQIIKVFEEATNLIFSQNTEGEPEVESEVIGNLGDKATETDDIVGLEEDLGDNVDAESPLSGIAEGVLGDIFQDQVGDTRFICWGLHVSL